MEVARFGDTDYLFVLSERGSVVGVYRIEGGTPVLLQLLPSGVSPEGVTAIPSRGLLATANEVDLVEDGLARAHVMLYALAEREAPAYPSIRRPTAPDAPIGWGALSGLAADPAAPGRLFAVSDSVYAMQPRIFEIDATAAPARIVRAIDVTRAGRPAQKLDLEGIAPDGEGGFWLASEGDPGAVVPHALIRVDASGEIVEEIAFPPRSLGQQTAPAPRASTVAGDKVWIAIQREWGDDPEGQVKLVAYNPATEEWGAVRYPLDAAPEGGWVGLSEITAHGDHVYLIERDNQIGESAEHQAHHPRAARRPGPGPARRRAAARHQGDRARPDARSRRPRGYVVDKVEGFAIDAAGTGFVITDNDGTDDSSGETHFLALGPLEAM